MTQPCYHCPDREMGCHGRCERYAAYRAKLDEANAKRDLERSAKEAVDDGVRRVEKRLKNKKRR